MLRCLGGADIFYDLYICVFEYFLAFAIGARVWVLYWVADSGDFGFGDGNAAGGGVVGIFVGAWL